MDLEQKITDLEGRALDIMEAGADITDDMLEQLRQDGQLRRLVMEMQQAKALVRGRREPIDVEARLQLFHAQHRPQHRARTIVLSVLAAAAVFIGVLFLLRLRPAEPMQQQQLAGDNVVFATTGQQQGISLTTEQGERVTLSPKGQQSTSLTLNDFREVFAKKENLEHVTLEVPYGKSADILLPDGSVCYLHPGSRVVFPTQFTGSQRVVQLDGQAYFKVAKDAEHPFVVMAGDLETTVLGTEFHIDSHHATVALINGSVSVSSGGRTTRLSPSQQCTLQQSGLVVESMNPTPFEMWRDGYLYFDQVELKNIMEAIGQNFNMTVEFHNTEALNLKMRFITARNNGVDAALETMNRMKKVSVYRVNNRIIVR